ncbi:1-aminocyclopropane-1-carboxylate deaminase/D-cysteine desulfhydrase [Colwellia hornerae]|uniref:1-aminocyclopropane-1-carboxylate deaminase/D-cysteine desulfhydrase n=1 Tax=Colwellia hornerae TaxID=89402 RepID=A0A5C6Q7L6_9GAMM|nr:pyridoxal-phosphate dependent enzyme [Colwellia hornerae]TWX49207.1 1-aminocyclopropane-1-carboxylate deaminase/D-cysteine desulfhydrase [Colwellia hornerae]TWX55634.1 1-aminocyclopropane-1-carboxylate deaminase/D-cysteine desulfhydrase [Colwellia hornerae]TWX64650.1 1-aminocyclopropane-1-carboxylate deaminase/D-cysteine desulfhydrase [Colwellia hornerae]
MKKQSPLQKITHPLFDRHQLSVSIKRDDTIHPIISGNKWRKLKFNLRHAKAHDYIGVVSFGGSFSNHIHALAFACHQQGLKSIGIIRGEKEYASNFTLSMAQQWGMELRFVNRKTYRLRENTEYLAQLQLAYPDYLIVPEGGSNTLALGGVGEVITELNQQCEFDTLLTPVGSGGTLAGLIKADNNQHNLLGIAVLKQDGYLTEQVNTLLGDSLHFNNWQIMPEFHRGGYAKFSKEDAEKILSFSQQTGFIFEPVYSGKMILALLDLIDQQYFPKGHRLVLLHTGGLQGIGGLIERGLLNANDWSMPTFG